MLSRKQVLGGSIPMESVPICIPEFGDDPTAKPEKWHSIRMWSGIEKDAFEATWAERRDEKTGLLPAAGLKAIIAVLSLERNGKLFFELTDHATLNELVPGHITDGIYAKSKKLNRLFADIKEMTGNSEADQPE